MLNFIRERAQGWIAWVIVGLLIIPFALWGINEYFGSGGKLVAATVNGVEIDQQEFQRSFYERRSQMQEMLGKQYDSRVFDPQLRQRVINELVEQELLLQNAHEMNYRISDQSVVATVQSIEAFQENGVYSPDRARQVLRSQGLSPAAFEQRVRRALLASQLPSGVSSTALVTDAALDHLIRLQDQKREAAYLRVSLKHFEDPADANEQAVDRYYEDHRDRFMTPEAVSVEYIELNAAELALDEKPSEDALREYYQSHSSQYVVPEERHVRHILITLPEGAGEDEVAAARKKAQALRQRIENGESFQALAKEYSQDPGSAAQGGDLGFIGRGMMEPDFEQAAFSLEAGQVSEPVLTSFGFHIIRVDEIRPQQAKPFEAVRDELLQAYRRDMAERRYYELADKLTNLAYESPDSLSEVAKTLGLSLKESPFFSRESGKGIFADPPVVAAAFSDEVLHQGYNSEPIEVGEDHVVVLRVKEHHEAAPRPLAEVADKIREILIREQARERARTAVDGLLQRLRASESRAAVAKELGAKWEQSGSIGRRAAGLDPAIAEALFRLPKPAEGGDSYGSTELATGDLALIALERVTDGDPASYDKAERENLQGQLMRLRGNEISRDLLESLKAKAKIRIFIDES